MQIAFLKEIIRLAKLYLSDKEMKTISAVIITYNEEQNIGACINGVKEIVDEIVIVDSFSTDRTEEICDRYNVQWYQRKFDDYSSQKNYANSLATGDLILSLDADEVPDDTLKQQIVAMKSEVSGRAYSFNRLTNYCGKFIRHCGWYPDTKIRIWPKDKARWVGTIHEQVELAGDVNLYHLKGDLLHYTFRTVEEHKAQARKFARLVAQERYRKGKRTNVFKIIFSPVARFVSDYFIKLGILDGAKGFTICRISAQASYLKHHYLLRYLKAGKIPDESQ